MTRIVLASFVAGLILVLGVATARVQSGNFGLSARLHLLQVESQWHARRSSKLREEIERFEFEGPVLASETRKDFGVATEPILRGIQ